MQSDILWRSHHATIAMEYAIKVCEMIDALGNALHQEVLWRSGIIRWAIACGIISVGGAAKIWNARGLG